MSKKVEFTMDASSAMKARDFLAFLLSRRTPEEWARHKTQARKMLEQLDAAIRIEVGPKGDRTLSLRPASSLKAMANDKKKTAKAKSKAKKR